MVRQNTVITFRHMVVVLGILLIIAAAFSVALLVQEPDLSHGSAHPDIEGMKIGSSGAARLKGIEAASVILFSGSIILMVVLMTLGVAHRHRSAAFWAGMGGVTLMTLFVCWRLFDSYLHYLATDQVRMILGFPEPTAWAVYGVWGSAALYSVVYVLGFRRFIFTKDDEQTFNDIVREFRSG